MIELKNISVDAEDGREILKDLSLSVDDSSFVVITGPNGGGKSTLVKVIMGIIKPSKGRIFFDGRDITDLPITGRAKLGIALAFQQPVRFKGISIRDMIEFSIGHALADNEVCAYLSEVGLCAKDYIDRPLDASLSGGEIKRIEIATIIARGAKLSIFDEPEAGIDLWSFQNLLDVFKRIRGKERGSVLIISHQERIIEIADDVVVIADGELTSRGAPKEFLPSLLCEDESCGFFVPPPGGTTDAKRGGARL